ncbi:MULTISPECIES: PAS domain-containing protein [Streptomyces]|uniref:PAS domain-containing protein n=1 Tax=Streptomyces TaxID=1883 RepID=UPI0004BD3FAF|nr:MULTISPECIES: PAS domain-containing protein [Streptomyces]
MTSIADELESVFDVIRQPVWAVDTDHSVRYANPAAAEAMGYGRPADLLGTDGRPATASGQPETAGVPQTAGRPGPVRGRGALTRVDGSLLPVEWTLVPLSRPGGDAALYVFLPLAEPALAEPALAEPAPAEPALAEPAPSGRCVRDEGSPFPLLAHRQVERQHQHARTLQHTVQERIVRALLGLSLARQELGTAPARAIGLLHDVARDTEEALAGVREVTDALSPGALRAGGLPAALAALAGRCPVPMTVSGTLAGRLPRLVESHLYLLVAEAVERAVDNGRAGRVRVTADLGTSLVVTVVDDGAPPVGAADLAALAALTERAAALDGTLKVRHTPGTGTTVTAVVPL